MALRPALILYQQLASRHSSINAHYGTTYNRLSYNELSFFRLFYGFGLLKVNPNPGAMAEPTLAPPDTP